MEIAPIPGIGALSAVKTPRIESWQPSVFDIEASQKPEDRGEKGSARKAAGSEETGENEENELTADGEMELGSEAWEEPAGRSVDYFA